MRILLVDDEESFRTILGSALSEIKEYEVTTCPSGEEAIGLITKGLFDLIVLDYLMPGKNGLNVLQAMHEAKIDTPVIMLTAAGSEHVAVEAMKLGAYDYMRKEVLDIEHFSVTLNGVYERYQFRKERERREAEEHEREKRLASIAMFRETIGSIAHFVNTALSVMTMNIEESERLLTTFVKNEDRKKFIKAFAEMKQEFAVVSSGMKAMLSLSRLVQQRYTGATEARETESNLQEEMRALRVEPEEGKKK